MTTLNFNEIFETAEATTSFDRLIATLSTAQKYVKAERDRLLKDAAAEVKFSETMQKVVSLNAQLPEHPELIQEYLDAAKEMQKAQNMRLNREDKSESQVPAIEVSLDKAFQLFSELEAA